MTFLPLPSGRLSALERRVLTRYPADVDDDQVAELERIPVERVRRIRARRAVPELAFEDFDALMRSNRSVCG
jgi:hypothetical protein